MAEVDYFLKIDGIEGESKDASHKGEIEILSFNWGAFNAGTSAQGGGGGAGKVSMQDFHFAMRTNKASPKLMLASATGEHIPTVVLTCRRAGREQQEYLQIILTDVIVSTFYSGGSRGDVVPADSFSLNFAKIAISYKQQKPDGTLDAPVKTGWDLKQNSKI